MITFSNKTNRESYYYAAEEFNITGEVDYNVNGFNASMNITDAAGMTCYGNISYDGAISINSPTTEILCAITPVIDTFYTELKAEIESRNK